MKHVQGNKGNIPVLIITVLEKRRVIEDGGGGGGLGHFIENATRKFWLLHSEVRGYPKIGKLGPMYGKSCTSEVWTDWVQIHPIHSPTYPLLSVIIST